MTSKKQLGIWLDHSSAHLIEFASDMEQTKVFTSKASSHEQSENLPGNENATNHKEQQKQGTFYKNLSAVIKNFDEVILFGPTTAKSELHNLLKADHQFDAIKIETKTTEKMSEQEMHDFVTAHFSRFDFKN